uniref:Uncharacterized protein n=1 Tax=Rhizophora mucronata TaxID=61149 RepID=A0A2P2PSZ0_RHIMU
MILKNHVCPRLPANGTKYSKSFANKSSVAITSGTSPKKRRGLQLKT